MIAVEIISIGDELLIGQTINSNAAWMGERLLEIGIHLNWVTTVGDDRDRILQALRIAESRADVILVTGGLGPTHDDITKHVLCEHYGAKLVFNQQIYDQVFERFQKRGITMAKVNADQAMVPDIAHIMPNKLGTAPGMMFRKGPKCCYVMPGVPFEMKAMMIDQVLPELKSASGSSTILVHHFMTTGVAESTLFEMLDNLPAIQQSVDVAFLPSLFGVKLRLMAKAESPAAAEKRLAEGVTRVREKVGKFIYADEDRSLEAIVAELLTHRQETVAVAESCTGGMVANMLTNIPGSSHFFNRGIVCYSNQSKIELLNVPESMILQHGAVSSAVALAMAKGMRQMAQTDYGLALTGIAGPDGGTAEKPVGLVFIACADHQGAVYERHQFANDRLGNKQRAAQAALNLLRKKILEIDHE
ncbi:MAG: competence/damage-inducible protein A [Calditrichaeota bacterium]|nr:MAG: competence/damage-inducible protein A [Calditrichota bacterium]